MEKGHFDNSPDSGSGYWLFVFVMLLILGIGYFIHMYNSSDASSDYWEIRIVHTPQGFEIKKYDYDDILRDAQQIVEDSFSE